MRTRYDAQYLRRGRLLLQRFGEFARTLLLRLEQPHVFDRNHSLVSEGCHQFDFVVRKRFDPLRASAITPIGSPSRISGTPIIERTPPILASRFFS